MTTTAERKRERERERERAARKLYPRLVVGHAAWWIPRPRGAPVPVREEEAAQKLPFAAALKDLLQNLSFHCYGKLVESGHRNAER